jgi:hydrogen peroxide-dependent heme synthase
VQVRVDALGLSEFLKPESSYVSILELGLYEATARFHATLQKNDLKAGTSEWNAAFDELLAEEARNPRNAGRLWAKIPRRRYTCFYPMDKKRGEAINWYMLPFEERAHLMVDHGKIGRSFAGLVTQVISGSIGFDDWEWGVDLYADDTRCASMRPARATPRSGRSSPACSSRSPSCRASWAATARRSCWRGPTPSP